MQHCPYERLYPYAPPPPSVVVVADTPPPAELLCLDVLHKSADDGAVVTLTPCALGDGATSEDGGNVEQKWEFSEVRTTWQDNAGAS